MKEKSSFVNGIDRYPISVSDHSGQTQSSSGGGSVSPDSVGSDEIRDGSIKEEDLSPELREGLHELENEEIMATDEDVEELFK